MPFEFEGGKRMNLATAGIEELKKHIDTLMIIPNEKLLEIATQYGNETSIRYGR